MTKIKSLSETHQFLNTSLIDVIKLLDPTGKSKYVELIYKILIKKNLDPAKLSLEIDSDIKNRYNIDENRLNSLTFYEKYILLIILNSVVNQEDYKILKDFIDYNENKLINVDISNINDLNHLSNLMTLAELKKNKKDSEKNIEILLKNDNWLILKPLSYDASIKYGKGTKWCTTHKDPYHFYRYAGSGVLIYIINLTTGAKTAFYHSIENDNETSFWNSLDQRIDSFQADLDNDVIDIIKKEIKDVRVANYNLFSENEKNKSTSYFLNEEVMQPSEIPVIVDLNYDYQQNNDYVATYD